MSDRHLNDLERELSTMRPASLPLPLAESLRPEPVDEPLTFADRVLVTFSSLGAIAAAVIVTVIASQLAASRSAPSATELAARQQRAAVYQQLLASR